MELFCVGEYRKGVFPDVVWDLCGVYSSISMAEKACVTPQHFVGPIKLNNDLPMETTKWEGAYYPLHKS